MSKTNNEYAKALFNIALEQKKVDEYAECLKQIKEVVLDNKEYLEYLYSPAEPLSNRLGAIEDAFSTAPTHIVSFLKLLCENSHIKDLPTLIDDFFTLKEISENTITAVVSSAVELSNEQKQNLENKLSKTYGKNIAAVYIIDKSLLGGVKIEFDGKTIDGTAAKKLNSLKGAIN